MNKFTDFPDIQQFRSAEPPTPKPSNPTTATPTQVPPGTSKPPQKKGFFARKSPPAPKADIVQAEAADVDLYAQQIHMTPIPVETEAAADTTKSKQSVFYLLQTVGAASTSNVARRLLTTVIFPEPLVKVQNRLPTQTDGIFTLTLSVFLLGLGLRAKLKGETNHRVLQFAGAVLLGWR